MNCDITWKDIIGWTVSLLNSSIGAYVTYKIAIWAYLKAQEREEKVEKRYEKTIIKEHKSEKKNLEDNIESLIKTIEILKRSHEAEKKTFLEVIEKYRKSWEQTTKEVGRSIKKISRLESQLEREGIIPWLEDNIDDKEEEEKSKKQNKK